MAAALIGPKFYGWDANGDPLAFGELFTYELDKVTPKPTYTTEDGTVENTNPVVLNGEGWANIHLTGSYYLVLTDSEGNEIWTDDKATDASSQVSEWVQQKDAEYVSPTSFKVAGNETDLYQVGRALQLNDATQFTGFVESAIFAAGETTVTVIDATDVITPALTWVRVGIFTQASFPAGVSGIVGVTAVQNISGITDSLNGDQIYVFGYLAGTDTDGGLFRYDSTRAKSDHDGYLVISPTVPWNPDIPTYQSGAGETDPSGNGVFVRKTFGLGIQGDVGSVPVPGGTLDSLTIPSGISFKVEASTGGDQKPFAGDGVLINNKINDTQSYQIALGSDGNLFTRVYEGAPKAWTAGSAGPEEAGFINSPNYYLYENGVQSGFFSFGSAIGASYETVGPTGSGATNTWSGLDSIPAGAKYAKLLVNMSFTGNAQSFARQQAAFRSVGGAALPASQALNEFGVSSGSASRGNFSAIVDVPLDEDGVFEMNYNPNLSGGATDFGFLYLIGYGA